MHWLSCVVPVNLWTHIQQQILWIYDLSDKLFRLADISGSDHFSDQSVKIKLSSHLFFSNLLNSQYMGHQHLE